MRYIAKSLGSSEAIVVQGRIHWLYHLRAWFMFASALGASLYFLTAYRLLPLAAVFGALAIYAATSFLVPLWTTEIGLTNQRLILKRGLLARHTSEMELWAIEALNLDQGLWGRLFGFGRINVQGTGDDSLAIPVIADPLEFRRAIESAIAQAAGSKKIQSESGA